MTDAAYGRRASLRERALRLFGSGDLYDRMAQLTADLASAEATAASRKADIDSLQLQVSVLQERGADLQSRLQASETSLARYTDLAITNRLVELDFPIRPRVRHGHGTPLEPRLTSIIAAGHHRYAERLRSFTPLFGTISKIKSHPENDNEPHWINDWLPMADALSIYAQLALKNPPLYLEVGSGVSTKFARRAICDFGLRTKIVSIDPSPRSPINALCDEVIRLPLEDVPAETYRIVDADTVIFFDGSHRCFQNSDATVFFTEILPAMPAGSLIGIHDIFLPADYPSEWIDRHYSEQYLLACWLLAGERLQVELPLRYCRRHADLQSIMQPLIDAPNLKGADIDSGAFWVTPLGG